MSEMEGGVQRLIFFSIFQWKLCCKME